ncbi:hypothetical protein SUGI_0692480 [Cryptomeria japonica]|nr:hypothetical protein SUGI_0692480 [Cryptomeria japonica]
MLNLHDSLDFDGVSSSSTVIDKEHSSGLDFDGVSSSSTVIDKEHSSGPDFDGASSSSTLIDKEHSLVLYPALLLNPSSFGRCV